MHSTNVIQVVTPSLIPYRKGGKIMLWMFYCPGCDMHHSFQVRGVGPKWRFNGDIDNPTFSPSLRVFNPGNGKTICHLYLKSGQIQYLSDSDHSLAGQTVPLEEKI